MYKIFCSLMLLALSAGAAAAADLGAQHGGMKDGATYDALAPVTGPTDYANSWGGFYIMGGVGRSSTAHDVQGRTDNSAVKVFSYDGTATGMAGALGLGYDAQIGKMVVGVMTDYQFRTASTTIAGVDFKQSDAVFIGGRLGYLPSSQMMIYVGGGYTWLNHSGLANNIQDVSPALTPSGATATTYGDGSYGGPTLLLGAEMPVTKGIYLGIEGRHTWLGKETLVSSKYTTTTTTTAAYTDEPSDWYVGVNLKLKIGAKGDALK